ncbi:Tektin-4 [Portunus trituberculatus]|uniref:Tektin n=1 Tax=Portunus trituberculatus TaxID=210409 RepID=A0A5B7D3A8_PORTR|nr:Tektin-4 [Portunus trituberculatus]
MEGPAVVQAVEEVGLDSARQEVAAPRETTTFTGLVPHTQARDVRPGNRPYSAVDVTGMRERLVRAVSPLQTVEEARAGEFTPTRWSGHHLDRHTHAQDLMQRSEKLRGRSRHTETYTEERTQSAENSVTQGLDQRLASTLELRTHLHHAINNTIDELALQNTMKSRLQTDTGHVWEPRRPQEHGFESYPRSEDRMGTYPLGVALFALELPERNNEECIHIRRFRYGVDRTRDPVVFALDKEKETLRTGRSLLTQTLKETEAQISRLLEVKRLLEHDWSDKQEAFQLDHFAAKLANDRVKAQFKAVSAALNEGVSVPDTWSLRSKEHLDVCRREITTGSQLRGAADQALRDVARDAEDTAEAVDVALNIRIAELNEAKGRLTEKDGMLRQEIAQEEVSIASLRQALQDKESPLQVAQSRHWTRSFRPGADRCLDQPHYRLKDELQELPQSIASLRERLRASEDTLEDLHRLHEDFAKDILHREHTLSLERRCVTVRSVRQTQEKLQGL